jgi:hypothetical protein
MKRPVEISLVLVPLLVVACSGQKAPDPCLPATYSASACQYAVDHQGYYRDGVWFPHVYSHPFFFYSGGYSSYIAGGGRVNAINGARYSPTAAVSGGTTRGGFGSSGGVHASGSMGAGS